LHSIKVKDLPFGKFRDKGIPIDNVSNFSAETEYIVYAASQTDLNLYRLIFVTATSMCKVVSGGEFDVSKRTVAATNLTEGDEVISVIKFVDLKNIVFQTAGGVFLRFDPETIPEKKKTAVGVRGMKLAPGDKVENVYYTQIGQEDLTIEYNGKTVELMKLKLGTRDTKGTKIRV
ncbi:MAG: DNA topoisomerase, partial [Lachnospiraceae bacterium]|nr:DNA topoisomerase [Lachnospiraceae bacterium]